MRGSSLKEAFRDGSAERQTARWPPAQDACAIEGSGGQGIEARDAGLWQLVEALQHVASSRGRHRLEEQSIEQARVALLTCVLASERAVTFAEQCLGAWCLRRAKRAARRSGRSSPSSGGTSRPHSPLARANPGASRQPPPAAAKRRILGEKCPQLPDPSHARKPARECAAGPRPTRARRKNRCLPPARGWGSAASCRRSGSRRPGARWRPSRSDRSSSVGCSSSSSSPTNFW